MTSVKTPSLPNISEDFSIEELQMFPHCANTILSHINRHLSGSNIDHDSVSRLLALRLVLTKSIQYN